jgi:PAS domain S-box-containing protein
MTPQPEAAERGGLTTAQLSGLIDRLPVPALIFNERLELVYGNAEAERLDAALCAGASLGDFAPQLREPLEPLLDRSLETGHVLSVEGWVGLRRRGNSYLQLISVPLAPGFVACVVIDQTAYKSAELAVMKSEERYRELVESLSEGIGVIDALGTFEFANPALERMLGVEPGRLVGRSSSDFLDLAELPAVQPGSVRRPRAEPLVQELGYQRPDGEAREFLVSVVPRLDNRGQLLGSLALFQDITLLKRAEQALREERNFTAAVIDTASALIVVLDRHGRIVRFNRGCEELTGYAAAEVIGKTVWDMLLRPEDVEPVQAVFSELSAGALKNVYENFWVHRDGGHRMISWSNSPIFDALGDVEYVVAVGVEITARVRAQEQLAQSERTARALLDASTDPALLLTPDFRVVAINDAGAESLGLKVEDLLGQYVTKFLPPAVAERRIEQAREVLATGQPLRFLDEDRGNWYDVTLRPVFDAQGATVLLALYGRDVTEHRQPGTQLHASETRFRSLVEAMRVGVIVRDRDYNITYANQALCEMLGYSREELLERNVLDLLTEAEHKPILERHARGEPGLADPYVTSFTRRDGSKLNIEITPQPPLSGEDTSDSGFAICREIKQQAGGEA